MTLSKESINQSPVCEHMHSITQTLKIDPDVHVLDSACYPQKHAMYAPYPKSDYEYLHGKRTVTYAKSLPLW